jgi:hypothetical protein
MVFSCPEPGEIARFSAEEYGGAGAQEAATGKESGRALLQVSIDFECR